MIKRRRLIRGLGKACNVASWMVGGAALLAVYLAHTNPLFDHPLRELRSSLAFDWFILYMLGTWLNPLPRNRTLPDVNPAWSGVGVVVATGLAGVVYVAWNASAGGDYIIAAAMLLVTIISAAMIWRFVARHADEIGEARFVTTGQ